MNIFKISLDDQGADPYNGDRYQLPQRGYIMSNNWGSPVPMPSKRDAAVTEWLEAKKALDAAKARENAARMALIEIVSDIADPMATGTENVNVGTGTVKIVRKLNYTFTTDNDGIDTVLDAIEKSMEGGNIIAERLVKWKGELSLSEYKLLSPENRARIDRILEAKPATPSVEFKAR